MDALKKFFFDTKELLTFLLVVGATVALVFLFVYVANKLDDTDRGKGFWGTLIFEFIAFALGAIAMFLWTRFM